MQKSGAQINRHVSSGSATFHGTKEGQRDCHGSLAANRSQLLTAAILGLMLVVLIALPFEKARVTRREFTRLQNDVKQLSEDVKGLQVAELDVVSSSTKLRQKTIKCRSRPLNRPSQLVRRIESGRRGNSSGSIAIFTAMSRLGVSTGLPAT